MHSVEGLGKTTLLAHFPKVLIVGNERGVPRDLPFSVATMPINGWLDMFDTVASLRHDEHDFLTLGIDTVDWLEPHIHKFVCERDSGRKTEMNPRGEPLLSIEDYGFGKGYIVAEEEFRRLIYELDILQVERGMHVVMLMHSHVVNFKNPSGPDFDRWEPKCHKRISKVVVEWSENFLFGHFETSVGKIPEEQAKKKDQARPKGISTGRRLLGTRNNAMYDAKNRHAFPEIIELEDPKDLLPQLLGIHLMGKSPAILASPHQPRRVADASNIAAAGAAVINGAEHIEYARDPEPQPQPSRVDERHEPAPAPQARRQPQPPSDPVPVQQPAQPAVDPAIAAMDAEIGAAMSRAIKAGPAFEAKLRDWVSRAGKPERIRAAIAKIDEMIAAAPTR